jgi:hypothetical protein
MTRDEIIRMARESGFADGVVDIVGFEGFERFATLVAERKREACAKLCDEMEEEAEGTECCKWPTPSDCAYAIRARG